MDCQTAFANGPVTELPPALKRQFYPTLLLLICLLPAYQYEYRARREVDRPLTVNHSPHQVFRDFLSKLAFLCCTDPGSNAVAACAIFKRMDDTIVYVLAFNSRSARELEVLKEKTASLLKQFGSPPFTDDRKKAILRLALSSNANRVRSYLKAFQKHLATCIEACERDDNNDTRTISRTIATCLRELATAARNTLVLGAQGSSIEVDVSAAEQLVWMIHGAYGRPVFTDLVQKRVSREELWKTDTYWHDLVHVAGRLMSYKQAIDVAVMVQERWPELFEDFEVQMVPSSTGNPQVLMGKALTAEGILHKTWSDEALLEEYYAQARKLQGEYGLDVQIKKKWDEKPKPIVHAELQLFNWVLNNKGDAKFFDDIEFIGTSKPPCKLCAYFFQEYPTGVEVRASHWNLYFNWHYPDIYASQGDKAVDRRKKVLHGIKSRLKNDIAEALKEKVNPGRPHDSSNYSTIRGLQSQPGMLDDGRSVITHFPILSDENESNQMNTTATIHPSVAASTERAGDSNGDRASTDILSALMADLDQQSSLRSPAARTRAPESSFDNAASTQAEVVSTDVLTANMTVLNLRPTQWGDPQEKKDDHREEGEDDDDGGGVLLFKGRRNTRNRRD